MGFLKNLFSSPELEIGAPVTGKVIPLTEVSDPTFHDEILGKGIAVQPSANQILAPCDAKVDLMFDTGHAVSLVADCGAEILIHVGLNTVELKGKHFTVHAKNGDHVTAGQLLIEFDREAVAAEGYDVVTPMIICNTDKYGKVKTYTEKTVTPGETVIGLVE